MARAVLLLGLAAGLVLGHSLLLQAAEPRDGEVLQAMQQRYRSIQSFRADFVQTLTNAASGDQETRNGTIAFEKPQSIRWVTETPEREILVVQEETVWDYIPAEEVAYRYTLEEKFSSKTMLEFIAGRVKLKEDFRITNQGLDEENGWTKIKLLPKEPEPNLVLSYIWIDEATSGLRQILLVDFWGNGNQLTFHHVEYNADLDPDLFRFEPPDGVQIMTNPASSPSQ